MLNSLALCAGLALSISPAPKNPAQEIRLWPVEQRVIQHTNAQRAMYGLPALAVDQNLVNSARRHAIWMTRARSMVHTNMPVGENIAMGQSSSSEVVRDWMNSSGHRANILNRGYSRIGVAAFHAPDGTTFWCQQFQ